MKKYAVFLMIILTFPLMLFCAPNDKSPRVIKNGKVYGVTQGLFRGKWWNHYERGISYGDGKIWDRAENDFRKAISQRNDDQRRARTYGMHFLDYFPHRELGIVLYSKGLFRNAVTELEASLLTQESAKAKFFLNKARKALLRSEYHDTTPPEININSFEKNIVVNQFFITVSGYVSDINYVSSIYINGVQKFVELSDKRVIFKKKIDLLPGINRITIEADDLTGNRSKKSFIVTGDFKGPGLSVVNYMNDQKVNKQKIDVEITFFDESGVKYLIINEKKYQFEGEKNGTTVCSVNLKKGKNIIKMEAVDIAGNQTKGELSIIYNRHGRSMVFASDRTNLKNHLVPNSWNDFHIIPGTVVAFNDINNGISDIKLYPVAQVDSPVATDAVFIAAKSTKKDTYPPEIRLRGLLKGIADNEILIIMERRRNNRFFIEGQATDPSGIDSIIINGRPVSSQQGKEIIFNRLIELDEGHNKINIKVTDLQGNREEKKLTVQRRIQQIDLSGSRMTLSIMPFTNRCISPALADSVYNLFVDEIINSERFNVVGRGIELEAILKELKLSQTDLVDKEKAVETGRLIGSETIMMGTIIEQKNSVEVFAKLINTETSKVLAAHDIYDRNKKRTKLEYLMQGLATKFIYSLPLVEGKVLAVKGDKFYLDIGRTKHINIKQGLKCLAYRSEPFIVDGEVLGEDTTILGSLLLISIKDKFSIAGLSEMNRKKDKTLNIKKMDKIITK